MPVKTIVVNGDQDWAFRSLLNCHSLDLFNVGCNVFFRDCCAAGAGSGGGHSVLANFPEDFSSDPFALESEVREDLREVFRSQSNFLSLAIILNQKDLALFSEAGLNWESSKKISKPARAALKAMRAAVTLIEQQTEVDGKVSSAVNQVWFSLVIRDAGSEIRHESMAADALRILSGGNCPVHNAVFLSNGVDRDDQTRDQLEHFTKLRYLIDIISDETSESMRKRLRRSRNLMVSEGISYLKLPEDADIVPQFSAVLRKSLADEIRKLYGAGDESADIGRAESFREFEDALPGLLPSIWEDCESFETVSKTLDIDVAADRKALNDSEDLRTAHLTIQDVDAILARLSKKRFRGKFFVFRRNPEFYSKIKQEYEAAFMAARETYSSVVDRKITEERKRVADSRRNLLENMHGVILPTGTEGDRTVNKLRDKLTASRNQTAAVIEDVRDALWYLKAEYDGGAKERSAAFELAQAAENNLMGLRALSTVIKVFLVSLLPVMILYTILWAIGDSPFTQWSDIGNALGAVGYITVFSAVLAAIAGLVTAFRLAKKRRIALAQLTARLQKNFDTLKGLASSRLALSLNRVRQADLELVRQHISKNPTASEIDLSKDFADLLDQSNSQFPGRPVEQNEFERLVSSAKKAFLEKSSNLGKIRAFLAERTMPDEEQLEVVIKGVPEQHVITKSCSNLAEAKLIWGESCDA